MALAPKLLLRQIVVPLGDFVVPLAESLVALPLPLVPPIEITKEKLLAHNTGNRKCRHDGNQEIVSGKSENDAENNTKNGSDNPLAPIVLHRGLTATICSRAGGISAKR